jgi:superfamily I DNA and/or RNA helicase
MSNNYLDPSELLKCLNSMKKDALRDAQRFPADCVVLDYNYPNLIVECNGSEFEDGDYVGTFDQKDYSTIGIVIHGSSSTSTTQVIVIEVTRYDINLVPGQVIQLISDPGLLIYRALINFLKVRLIPLEGIRLFNGCKKAAKPVKNPAQYSLRSYGNNVTLKLNLCQNVAVDTALNMNKDEVLLITGPPGTGKTRVIATIANELQKRGEKVLIVSHSNTAVDNAIELLDPNNALRVGVPLKIRNPIYSMWTTIKTSSNTNKIPNNILQQLNSLKNNIEKAKSELSWYLQRQKLNLQSSQYSQFTSSQIQRLIDQISSLQRKYSLLLNSAMNMAISNSKIIGSTAAYLIMSEYYRKLHFSFHFDTIIVDESSQLDTIMGMLLAKYGDKWIFVGDDKQLPPVAKCHLNRDDLSTYKRLKQFYIPILLKTHYRSHPHIIGFSNKYIYNNQLIINQACYNNILVLNGSKYFGTNDPFIFVDVPGVHIFDPNTKSCKNICEAEVVVKIIEDYLNSGGIKDELGVITPYRLQKKEIKDKLSKSKVNGAKDVEVDTVDAYQGREKDVIVISLVSTYNRIVNNASTIANNPFKFSADQDRFNVAITRARKKLIIVGNLNDIKRFATPILNNLVQYINQGYVKVLPDSWKSIM